MNKFLWLDLETTGLNPDRDLILEVSVIVTNYGLQELETLSKVVFVPEPKLIGLMNEWAQKTHRDSGLVTEVLNADVNISTLEDRLVNFIARHFNNVKPLLCGNSIHFDRGFIKKQMPRVDEMLHYRMIDVSGMYEALKLTKGIELDRPISKHRGLSDIRDSIKLFKGVLAYFDSCIAQTHCNKEPK